VRKTRSLDQVGGDKPSSGRPQGVANIATTDARKLCQSLVENPAYRTSFAQRLKAGELPPALEAMVWHYAYGKPKETADVRGTLADLLGRVLKGYEGEPA
jgi:hypothetical protein